MKTAKRWQWITGLVLHALIAAPMILAGGAMLLGLMSSDGMDKYGLGRHVYLIGAGELITGIFLLVPRMSSLGVLLASGFWGGAIMVHMSHAEPYVLQSALLVLTWVGAYLRQPAMFSSFFGPDSAPDATR